MEELIQGVCGGSTSWEQMACVDFLVERSELYLIARGEVTQWNVYRGKWSKS